MTKTIMVPGNPPAHQTLNTDKLYRRGCKNRV